MSGVWAVARAVAWRSVHRTYTKPTVLIPSILFPLFFFAAFAGGLSAVGDVPGFDYAPGYTTFQYAFVLMQSATMAGIFTGLALAEDFDTGFSRRLMLAAPSRGGIVLGLVIGAAIRWFTVIAFVTALALLVGLEVLGGPLDIGGIVLLALAMNITGTLWSTGVAMRLRSAQAGPLMQTPSFIVLFLAPVYVPLDLLTGWVETAASVNPATAIYEGVRSLLAGAPEGIGLAAAVAVGLVAVFGLWAARGLRSAEAAG